VKTEKTDPVVDAAKQAGATGATVIPARGTGIRRGKNIFWPYLRSSDRHYHVFN